MALILIILLILAAISAVVALSVSRKTKRSRSDTVRHAEVGKPELPTEIVQERPLDNDVVEDDISAEIVTEDTEPSEEPDSTPQDVLEEYNDSRQDLLDFAAAMSDSDAYKNRYTALQNTSFVVKLLTEQYEASTKEVGFYDFVLDFCERMKFQSGDDAYMIAEELATKLKNKKHDASEKAKVPQASTATYRPSPESIYPLTRTGDKDVDEFIDIAKELLHKRIRHLKTSEKENEVEIGRVVRKYRPREGKSFADFFSNQFQFGYLKEKRFQELYFLLSQIAQAKIEGLSKSEIIRRIDATYRVDDSEESQEQAHIGKTEREVPRKRRAKDTPYIAYSDAQHRIISVATRITRTYYDNKLFRRTGALAVDLVNKFHEAPEGTISERTFYTINLSGLQKDDKKNATVYAILIDVVNFVFQGMSEDDVIRRIFLDKRMPYVPQKELEAIEEKRGNSKAERPSSCPSGRSALIKTIKECGMLAKTQECINLAVFLDSTLNRKIQLSEIDYYKALKSVIKVKQMDSFNSRLLSFILDFKIKEVPDASMRAFVEPRFPSAYRIKKTGPARKQQNKQR